ncbi:hypothetical protein V1460_26160 [Streptomyces sp. SCSIO 30461]|uniref:hypothetical protein n=1 Tax=Streptomyces sp. SCSIO 30461 TaxID=3118085 RepID=UPI0030CFD8D8
MRNPETARGAPPAADLSTEDLTKPGTDRRQETERSIYPGQAAPVTEAGPAADAAPESRGAPATETAPPVETAPPAEAAEEPVRQALVPPGEAEGYRDRWQQIQGTFVDDPREAVRNADTLVAEVIQSLATTFADHKRELEGQWSRGEEIQTEDLRMALQRYRAFFNQLLNA